MRYLNRIEVIPLVFGDKKPERAGLRRFRAVLRSPGAAASALCLCLLLGFFLGSLRSRGAPVTVSARAPAETVRAEPGELVDINRASEAQLQTLPGIGPALAGRIVAYREENGPFRYVYELTNVKGIGSSTLETLRELITLGPEE